MSYSFAVKAASKAEAKQLVAAELDSVLASQPIHEADRQSAEAAAGAFIDLLRDDDGLDVLVSVHGSVYVPDAGLQSASVGVSAQLVAREG